MRTAHDGPVSGSPREPLSPGAALGKAELAPSEGELGGSKKLIARRVMHLALVTQGFPEGPKNLFAEMQTTLPVGN